MLYERWAACDYEVHKVRVMCKIPDHPLNLYACKLPDGRDWNHFPDQLHEDFEAARKKAVENCNWELEIAETGLEDARAEVRRFKKIRAALKRKKGKPIKDSDNGK